MTAAWREMAWNDMGGSEPSYERADYEIRADVLMPVVREACAEAWDDGYDECEAPHFIDRRNPWREAGS